MLHLLEGKADHYEQFLSSTANANLVDISDDFHFRIQSLESPTLLLRHVSTHGHATNHGELSDAFHALMLSYRPGGFSSDATLSDSAEHPNTTTLHWHLANRSCINHHRDSKVTYLRLESAALLRSLAAQAIAVSQLNSLQDVAAPAGLVQLIENLGPQLASAERQQHGAITEFFLNRLAQELRQLLGPPKPSDANAAGHCLLAIETMMAQLSAPISLQRVAKTIALTPRTVQACFKTQLGLSPMRWLKLARISRLRQHLWDPDLTQRSLPQLMADCGLSNTSLNRKCYREIYGNSPRQQIRHLQTPIHGNQAVMKDSLHRQFNGLEDAIQYLERLKNLPDDISDSCQVSITISTSAEVAKDQT